MPLLQQEQLLVLNIALFGCDHLSKALSASLAADA